MFSYIMTVLTLVVGYDDIIGADCLRYSGQLQACLSKLGWLNFGVPDEMVIDQLLVDFF